ncbi:MAG TPA: hypothetical protein VK709_11370 [Candidatus Saccharimonadales bacterium]|jgi:hypothetical protein|nr:hypothetical protein [Candidatus Saccharimonadales bacterium]
MSGLIWVRLDLALAHEGMDLVKRLIVFMIAALFLTIGAEAQSIAPPASLPPPASVQKQEFLQAADEVMAEMSKLVSLPILSPLKKSMRSREEIRAYLLQKMKEDKDADKRYADQKTMEKFGLLPKDYPLDQVLVKVLTEQIAGLYDPDSQEFFIADWTSPADQRSVMSHELTHALQDQHFHIDKWTDAAKPNDDGELARDAVLEGSAMAAMLDYELRGKGTIRDLGDFDPAMFMGDVDSSPELSKAPKVLQDELLFPYLAGITFTQHILKAGNGWADFYKVFDKPPASTQQIMHPDLYLQGVMPAKVELPAGKGLISSDWKKLDENDMGEFGVQEILKQFLPKPRSVAIAASWGGDRYAIFENQKNKRTMLEFRLHLANEADAARFFGAYSEVLDAKYSQKTNLMRRPNFFSFDTPEDGVFLRCMNSDCFILEGGTRTMFDHMTMEMGWPAGPVVPMNPSDTHLKETALPLIPQLIADARRPMQLTAR